jgi:hypothetical protein
MATEDAKETKKVRKIVNFIGKGSVWDTAAIYVRK